jgi:hypothetical protein
MIFISLLPSTRLDLGLLFVLVVGNFFVFYATNPNNNHHRHGSHIEPLPQAGIALGHLSGAVLPVVPATIHSFSTADPSTPPRPHRMMVTGEFSSSSIS